MAGLFRFNTSNNSTPKRRSTFSPFCTSPGQFNDASMDSSYALGYRSPSMNLQHGGNASPGQGRSVREFEEQMASLRNENFNLKLRLYFLEQKIPGYASTANSSADGHESLLKQNVDLKVDIEVLKRDLQQKQSLLCEAAKAMELMEEQQKETEEKSRGIIEELNEKIQYLEEENQQLERATSQHNIDELMRRSDLMGDVDILQKVRELEGQVKQYEEKTEELINKQTELEQLLAMKDESLQEKENNTKELEFQIAELQEQLDEKANEAANLEKKYDERMRKLISEKDAETVKLGSENKSLQLSIEKLKAELERDRTSFEDRNKKLKEQQHLMEEMQNPKLKEELLEHKTQLANKTCELNDVQERLQEKTILYEKSCKAIQKLMQNAKELQNEIDRLNKRTNGSHSISYLKESEELSPTYGTDSTALIDEKFNASSPTKERLEAMLVEKDAEIVRLKEETKKKTVNLQTIINKELGEKNREIERLKKLINSRSSGSLRHDVDPTRHSFSDSDYMQALEKNKRLQNRVDHLTQKLSVASEHSSNEYIQQLKDQIREAREEAERSDRWRKECTDLCGVLTDRLEELAGFLDTLLKHKDILGTLGADRRKAMRKAVDRSLELSRSINSISLSHSGTSIADNSLDLLANITNILDHTSDKENRTFNWNNETMDMGSNHVVEDLKAEVRALRKELDKKKIPESVKKERRSLPVRLDNNNQSESEAWSEPDRNVSLARIGLEESHAKKTASKEKEETHGNTSSESPTDVSRKCKAKHHDKIAQLENIIAQKENKILQSQCELVDADNRLKRETLGRLQACQELEDCRKRNATLESKIANVKEQLSKQESCMREVESCRKQVAEKQLALDKLTEIREQLCADIRATRSEVDSLKLEQTAIREKYLVDLENVREQEQKKMANMEAEISRKYEEKLQQVENNHKEYLARDWISRVIYEQTKRELEDAQKKCTAAQFTIEFLRENESELQAQLIENEKQRRNLKQSLDEATLQSSKIVVERTKAITEKLQLEAQLEQLAAELETIKRERTEAIEQNIILNNQVLTAKEEIEKAVKQTSNGNNEPLHPGSGYTSEEVNGGEFTRSHRNVIQRLDNSSPDLGIESDAGRTSSTDQAGRNVKLSHGTVLRPKPELHHLNIVDEASQDVSSTTFGAIKEPTNNNDTTNNNDGVLLTNMSSSSTHDCAKVDQELAELRRKLVRQKRALENTWNSLRVSNQRKEQIERDIRHQIMKTQTVLKSVRTNMECELAKPRTEGAQLKRDKNKYDVE